MMRARTAASSAATSGAALLNPPPIGTMDAPVRFTAMAIGPLTISAQAATLRAAAASPPCQASTIAGLSAGAAPSAQCSRSRPRALPKLSTQPRSPQPQSNSGTGVPSARWVGETGA